MIRLKRTAFLASGLLLALHAAAAWAQPAVAEPPQADPVKKAEGNRFLRLKLDNKKPQALQTAVITYRDPDGVEVDLVGAVHIGERSYYAQLNRLFESYEVVLYELVAPQGTRIPKGGGRGRPSAIGGMQRGMQSLLGLEYQLDRVDYTKKNFVHADMSPTEFAESMENRGESFAKMFFRMMGQGAALQGRPQAQVDSIDMWTAILRQDKQSFKTALARQFQDIDGVMSALNGDQGSTIITERNRKALEVLRRQIDAGKKRIAVFYGAGHFPDMDMRLKDDFRMRPVKTRWITAWDLSRE